MASFSSPFNSPTSLIYYQFPIISDNGGTRTPIDLSENSASQELYNCVSIKDPTRSRLVETTGQTWKKNTKVFKVSPQEFMLLQSPLHKIQLYADLIQHHAAERVAFFLQQAIATYKTPFHFEIADTESQFFTAPTLKITSSAGSSNLSFQAAHSSTIPSLKACLRSEYTLFQQNPLNPPRYFSFLKASHLENLNNSTVGLPASVNKIDTLIDGKANSPGLRQFVIDLINELAQAKIDPIQATRKFIDLFNEQLILRPTKSKTMDDEKRLVITIYQEQFVKIRELAAIPENTQQPHPFFDYLLSVNMNGEDEEDTSTIRSIVYRRKFEIIRESLLTESRIQQVIDETTVGQNHEKKHLAKLAVVYSIRADEKMRKTLEKLFCVSVDVIQQDQKLCAQLEAMQKHSFLAIDHSVRGIRLILRNFRKLENSFQAMLLREFRTTLRSLKQSELAALAKAEINEQIREEYKKVQPNFREIATLSSLSMSQSTISRLENSRIHIIKEFATPESQRRKALTLQHAEVIAKVLRIQTGHFFCSFFASDS